MHRIMLDLETLDTVGTAVIVSIGAVRFDTGQPEIGEPFYTAVQLKGQDKLGRTISPSTVLWWLSQGEEARKVFTDEKAVPLPDALRQFAAWVTRPGVDEMWGNGADFDCVLLGSAYDSASLYRPWSYGKNRCFRTLRSLHPGVNLPREGTHHNALDDARHQAVLAAGMLS